MLIAEPAKHLRLLPNVSVVDMESQIGLFDFTVPNGSGELIPDREASCAILTEVLVSISQDVTSDVQDTTPPPGRSRDRACG